MKLSIGMPACNERDTIGLIVPRVLGADLGPLERELVIVDDGSTGDLVITYAEGKKIGLKDAFQALATILTYAWWTPRPRSRDS